LLSSAKGNSINGLLFRLGVTLKSDQFNTDSYLLASALLWRSAVPQYQKLSGGNVVHRQGVVTSTESVLPTVATTPLTYSGQLSAPALIQTAVTHLRSLLFHYKSRL
jgi:hypothetical protein